MDKIPSRRQVAAMKQSLFDQGYLDEQFIQLEELQDDANPNFVEEIVTLYYRDSSRLISSLDHTLESNPLDFNKLDTIMHQFKGSSSSIGAKKVKAECTLFREYCRARNGEGCRIWKHKIPDTRFVRVSLVVIVVLLCVNMQMQEELPTNEERICNTEKET
ncbi:Histidine-containing phosphotransfer protein 5 isoform B [Glycine soja]|uniref:Histidine-containing phosphotransfer protein n=1 Tax=Glycine soja TaxID=3848 RepID=A0A445GMP5_GLYSO|nr:Histidine-containing phosphotransfer protein 5 isoform B [Glycine soja]